jgi:hypothetical protein
MTRRIPRWGAMLAAAAVAGSLLPGSAHAGGPGVWTKISNGTGNFANEAGMLRTADGKLHLVWRKELSNGKFTYGTSTISPTGKLLSTGAVGPVSDYKSLHETPRLVRNGSGLRLVFIGNEDTNSSNFFSQGAVYTATSANGSSWTREHVSMSAHAVLNDGLGATVETNGSTPVASFGLNEQLYYHEGTDPSAPAAQPDGEIDGQINSGLERVALARAQDGSIWMAWFQRFQSKQGFWVAKILPSEGTPTKAPSSGNTSQNNDPGHQVGFVARTGGGLYMVYCSPTSSKQCVHINLWKVGSSTPTVVPGSATGNARFPVLSVAPKGRLWIAWFDSGKNKIEAVRTNEAVTKFGPLRTVPPPPHTFIFEGLQVEGSSGTADLVANSLLTTSGNPTNFFHTQVKPALTMKASPSTFSHTKATTVTFTVTDAGQPVAGATVTCLGKSGKTGSSGQVNITFPKGTATGNHQATARKGQYASARITIKVT